MVIRPSALGTVGHTILVPPPGLKDAVRTQVTEAVEWLYRHIEHIPAEDRVGIGVVRIGDAAVAYKMNWLGRPARLRDVRCGPRGGVGVLPNRVLIADGEDWTAERGREDAEVVEGSE